MIGYIPGRVGYGSKKFRLVSQIFDRNSATNNRRFATT